MYLALALVLWLFMDQAKSLVQRKNHHHVPLVEVVIEKFNITSAQIPVREQK